MRCYFRINKMSIQMCFYFSTEFFLSYNNFKCFIHLTSKLHKNNFYGSQTDLWAYGGALNNCLNW